MNKEGQDYLRKGRQKRGRSYPPIVDGIGGQEPGHGHRRSLGGGATKLQGKREGIPTEDKAEKRGSDYAWLYHGQKNLKEDLPPGISVKLRRSFDIGRDIFEESSQDPNQQRKTDKLIDPNQPEHAVDQTQLLIDEIKRNDDENLRSKAKREESEGDVLAALKLISAQA